MIHMNANKIRDYDPEIDGDSLMGRLRWAREQKGWTQKVLAYNADIAVSTVGMIESGERISKGSLPALAEALGVRHKWLLSGELPVLEVVRPDLIVSTPQGTVALEMKSTANNPRPQPMGDAAERRLTRFLAVLFQLPESERDRALVAATEVLLDHLPPPPSA